MKEPYRVGFDLGTNSLGWAMWELAPDGQPVRIMDAGVRIFSDGREPGKGGALGDPLAVTRRTARGMRRRRDRHLQRKRILVNTLVKEGLWPAEPERRFQFSEWDPYYLRTKAISSRLSPEELGRVLLHLGQRRGFKSNRKDSSKDDEKGVNKERIQTLKKELEQARVETLGEYLNAHKRSGVRFREDSRFFPDRQNYIDEFLLIKDRQKEYFPKIDWQRLGDLLFYQRPLRPQKKGTCRYYPDQERAHKSLPSTHRFRILQELSNLKMIGDHGETISLSHEERDHVFGLLENQKSLTFTSLRKKLKTDCLFNLESEKRKELLGNTTSFTMRKPELFGDRWDQFDEEKQDDIVLNLMDADYEEDLRKYFDSFSLDDKTMTTLLDLTLQKGIARFSPVLHRECVHVMKRDYCGYSEALESLGHDHRAPEGEGTEERLPYYGEVLPESCIVREDRNQNTDEAKHGKISNPTVHITLNQLRKVTNALIEKYGKPEEIVLELSRELKVGGKLLSEIISEQGKNQKRNETLEDKLKNNFGLISPSVADRQKLMYYEELQGKNSAASCPYCGKVISAQELFTGSIEVEHILPFSRTLDDGRNNKTIAHRHCNRFKREKSPYEAFGQSPSGFNWEDIQKRSRTLPKAKAWRFQINAMERFEKDSGFIQRQLTDNAYIAKVARRYLTAVCPPNKIWAVNGRQTAVLRRKWDLNSILSKDGRKKNRSDHRHHAVDAAVIALIDRSLVKKIADANRLGDGDLERFGFDVPDFPGGFQGREQLCETVRGIFPSIKPDHGLQGRLFKETAYGKIKKALPLAADKLTKDMIPNIVPARVRQEVQEIVSDAGLNKGRKKIRERYAELSILAEFWVTRKPLTSLGDSDLKTPSYGRDTKGPSDFALRKKIADHVTDYLKHHPEEKIEAALEDYTKRYGVRHVRYIPKNQEIMSIKSSPGKGYELGSYAYVDVWMMPAEQAKKPRYEGVFVSLLEANLIAQGRTTEKRPHPAAKKLMRLFKKDTIAVLEEDEWKYYQVKGFITVQNRIDILPLWQSDADWFENTNHSSVHTVYPPTRTQNFKSINALWQQSRVRKITVHYDGTYR